MYYLAYGSNLNISRMNDRCKEASIVGTSVLKDYRLIFKRSKSGSYLTVTKEDGYNVPLGVWEISQNDLESLDICEGYPTFYYRKEIEVLLKDKNGNNRNIKGIIYIMHEDRKFEIPKKWYIDICKDGYKEFGFDASILDEAVDYSTRKILDGDKNDR